MNDVDDVHLLEKHNTTIRSQTQTCVCVKEVQMTRIELHGILGVAVHIQGQRECADKNKTEQAW